MKSQLLFTLCLSAILGLHSSKIAAQNYALEFDGVDDQINVSTLSTSSSFTYEMWIYFPTDPSGFVTLLDFDNDQPWLGIASGTFALWDDNSTLSTDFILQKDRWKHVAVTYASNTIKLYVDGDLEKTITKTISNSVTGMTIGFSTGDKYFPGRMDELRIWNTERTVSEIADNRFSSLAGTETGLVAYYDFDEGTGTSLSDLTSNNHDGTLSGFSIDPWVTGAPINMNVWDGSTWSDGTPASTEDVMFEDDYDFSSAGLEVNSVYVSSGADVNVNGKYLKVNGDLQNNGDLTISSGSSLLTSGDQLTLGNDINFQRTSTHSGSSGQYSIVGMPTTSGNRDALGDIVYQYDETELYNSTIDDLSGGNDGLDRFSLVSSGESLAIGSGYFSAFTGDVSFLGQPNAGPISVSITDTDHDVAGTTDEENYEGFNLISNPYPAPITLSSFISANTSQIEGTIYIWDDGGSNTSRRTDNDYILANTMTETGGSGRVADWDGNIRSFQGFFVQAKSAGTVSFTDAMKTTGDNDADAFFRKGDDYQLLRLSLSDAEVRSECVIGSAHDATLAYDELYDAHKPISAGAFSIYSLLENKSMGIQAIPDNYDKSIKIGFQIDQAGIFSISADENSFNQPTTLIDHYTNEKIDLSIVPYSFSSSKGRFEDRFEINFSHNLLSIEPLRFKIHQSDKSLIITNSTSSNSPFKIVTLDGKTLISGSLKTGRNEINILEDGVLILRLGNNETLKFYKK